MAVVPYAMAAVAALLLARRGSLSLRTRGFLALAVLVTAALLPMGLEVAWRARTEPGLHAQSEAIVTEEAANALVDGSDPYAATYLEGPLAARPIGTKTHFPYLPAMLMFGLPRAVDDHHAWADARLGFAVVALGVGALALWRSGLSPPARLRAFQFLAILPTGALLLATGGDDLPVLALLLLALTLAASDRITASGFALGVAMALKQTAWVVFPFLGVALLIGHGRRAWRFAAAAAVASLPLIIVFALWDPAAMWEDVVRFPLGLGQASTAAATPTVGSVLIDAFPHLRTGLTVLMVVVVSLAGAAMLFRWPPATVGAAALRAAALAALAIVLAPAARAGYVVYPLDLAVWGWLLASSSSPTATQMVPMT
jgi:hypothetical protein